MTIAEYETLTGITVASDEVAKVEAAIARSQSILETLLGYTLDPDKVDENFYNEEGKLTSECACSNAPIEDPDPVVYAYRLFGYDERDKYLPIDPCSDVYAVKLVKGGITVKTLDPDSYRLHYGQNGIIKFIEVNCCACDCGCWCDDSGCVQLAVDAQWVWNCEDDSSSSLNCIPSDLLYLWAEMAQFYGDQRRDITYEVLATHTYRRERRAPENEDFNRMIIAKYAGYYGVRAKVLV